MKASIAAIILLFSTVLGFFRLDAHSEGQAGPKSRPMHKQLPDQFRHMHQAPRQQQHRAKLRVRERLLHIGLSAVAEHAADKIIALCDAPL